MTDLVIDLTAILGIGVALGAFAAWLVMTP